MKMEWAKKKMGYYNADNTRVGMLNSDIYNRPYSGTETGTGTGTVRDYSLKLTPMLREGDICNPNLFRVIGEYYSRQATLVHV